MFTRKPWNFGSAICNRDYLWQNESFDSLAQELSDAMKMVELSDVRFCIEPKKGKFSGKDPLLRRLQCRRPSWKIPLDLKLLDKFFNGRMGIRAQYYQSPYHGQFMNRLLVHALKYRLVEFAMVAESSSGSRKLIEFSLAQPSAKAWICEENLAGEKIIRASDLRLTEDKLQNDWLDVARAVKSGMLDGASYRLYCAAINGVRAPLADRLEVKGAWVASEDHCEYVTPDKRDRDCQLFMFGFA